MVGLTICFVTFGMYTGLRPYVNKKDDTLAQVAQICIFFSLLVGLTLRTDSASGALDAYGVANVAWAIASLHAAAAAASSETVEANLP